MGKACDLLEAAETRRTRNESTSEGLDKTNTSIDQSRLSKSPARKISINKPDSRNSPVKEKVNNTAHLNLQLDDSNTRKRFLNAPQALDIHQSSSVSTPDTVSPASQSLGFLGESRSGLMANSMVNLSSVGINQGPHSPMVPNHGQDTGPPSPDMGLLDSLGEQTPSSLQSGIFQYYSRAQPTFKCTSVPENINEVSPVDCGTGNIQEFSVKSEMQTKLEACSKEPAFSNKVDEMDVCSNEEEIKKENEPVKLPGDHKLYSCDSIRYRSTDDDVL